MPTTPSIPPEILEKFGLDILPEDERDELLADVGEVVFRAVMRRVWDTLTPERQDELLARMEASNAEPENEKLREEMDAFLKENVPDLDRFVREEGASLLETQRSIYGEIAS